MRTLLVLVIMAVLTGLLYAGESNDYVLTQSSLEQGKLLVYAASKERIEQTPSWDGKTGQPPLSLQNAMQAAIKYLEHRHILLKQFSLLSAYLQRLGSADHGRDYHWCYMLLFLRK